MTKLSLLGCLAASAAALRWAPTVTLEDDSVVVNAAPEQVLDRFRRQLSSGTHVIAAQHDRVVRRFAGRAGRFRYATIELVELTPNEIRFEHLAGPFTRCSEAFHLASATPGTTRITHSGSYALRGGLWTWPLSRTAVKSAFERHVHEHLNGLRDDVAALDEIGR